MFYKIEVCDQVINGNKSYCCIKNSLLSKEMNKEYFIRCVEMECKKLKEANIIEFNINVVTLLLSFSAFFISVFEFEPKAITIAIFILFAIVIISFAIALINLHMQKSSAIRILYVIEDIKEDCR